mmetsp:Transcript_35339/g.83681  ORF Transcript_35339/g.83681 Transcript_35339/m.83681 type:complete len:537 (-) Transcript_35339:1270-2880(-)
MTDASARKLGSAPGSVISRFRGVAPVATSPASSISVARMAASCPAASLQCTATAFPCASSALSAPATRVCADPATPVSLARMLEEVAAWATRAVSRPSSAAAHRSCCSSTAAVTAEAKVAVCVEAAARSAASLAVSAVIASDAVELQTDATPDTRLRRSSVSFFARTARPTTITLSSWVFSVEASTAVDIAWAAPSMPAWCSASLPITPPIRSTICACCSASARSSTWPTSSCTRARISAKAPSRAATNEASAARSFATASAWVFAAASAARRSTKRSCLCFDANSDTMHSSASMPERAFSAHSVTPLLAAASDDITWALAAPMAATPACTSATSASRWSAASLPVAWREMMPSAVLPRTCSPCLSIAALALSWREATVRLRVSISLFFSTTNSATTLWRERKLDAWVVRNASRCSAAAITCWASEDWCSRAIFSFSSSTLALRSILEKSPPISSRITSDSSRSDDPSPYSLSPTSLCSSSTAVVFSSVTSVSLRATCVAPRVSSVSRSVPSVSARVPRVSASVSHVSVKLALSSS